MTRWWGFGGPGSKEAHTRPGAPAGQEDDGGGDPQEAIELAREKTHLAHALALRGRYPHEAGGGGAWGFPLQAGREDEIGAQVSPVAYDKAEDDVLLPLIREIIDEHLTYGYRRVCTVLKRRLSAMQRPPSEPQTRLPHHAPSWPSSFSAFRTAPGSEP
jgi:hypothetical protein